MNQVINYTLPDGRGSARCNKLLLCAAVFLTCAGAQTTDAGKRQFQARCGGCHGDDGTGGGHGPNIIDVRQPRATSAEAVRELIRKGIPGAGMPAFALPDVELNAITAYFMALKTPASGPRAMGGDSRPGDAKAGEQFFTGQGNCGRCPML